MADLWMFLGALAVAYLVPGPDMVLLLQVGALRGRAAALSVAAGLAVARAAHVALAAFGLAALMRTSPLAFEAIRLAGAAYLVWLGIGVLNAPSRLPQATWTPRGSLGSAAIRGLLTNLLNPKALLFCSVLLPQFVRPGADVAPQFLVLGAILVGVGAAFDAVYALGGAATGNWLEHRPIVRVMQRYVFASLLIGFGVRLLFADRPQ